jgi:hypothetical protein
MSQTNANGAVSAVCRTLVHICWALWFGGLMALFIFVQVLFHQTPEDNFLISAPKLFFAFEKYQLCLAGLVILGAIVWRAVSATPRLLTVLLLFLIASVGAILETALITPKIDAMRQAGQTHTPEFMRIHGLSMLVYMSMEIVLMIAGIFLATIRRAGDARH